jgi:NAD(P)-dependent dehydrogenase (short-subunit alcohol dehydrogenase family)
VTLSVQQESLPVHQRFNGKTVMVTGGTSGIGAATVARFVAEGASVVATSRSDAKELKDQTLHDVRYEQCDHSDVSATIALFERLGEIKLDAIFVNAGLARFALFGSFTPEMFDEQFEINVRGAFFTVQAALPYLNQGAAIILNTSVQQDIGTPMASVYAASKAALGSLARSLAVELAPQGFRVNAVSPGGTNTPIYGKMGLPPEMLGGMIESYAAVTPARRFADPDDIARSVLFLASEESAYIYGVNLPVDGGYGLHVS